MTKLALKTIEEFTDYLRGAAESELGRENAFLDSNLDKFMNKIKGEVPNVSDIDYIEINSCENGIVDFDRVDIVSINIDFKTYWVKLIVKLSTREISIGAVEL